MRERSEIVVLTIVVTCEARVGMLYTRKDEESSFHHCGGSVKLVEACYTARRHLESSFHHWEGAVRCVLACLSARKHRES